jgi:hypothetical protein
MTAPARTRLAHTPYLDAWRKSLRAATDGRGLKTELARFMAAHRGQPLATWRGNIGRILREDQAPGPEDLLAISAWMAAQKNPKPLPTPTDGTGAVGDPGRQDT